METMMAKKSPRGQKTAAVRDYQSKNPNATATEIVAALKEQGIEVSPAIVYNLRSTANKSGAKRGRKPASTSASSNGAAEQGGKSKAVRDAVRELGRKTPTKEIIEHLSRKGVNVSVALVSNVKSRMKPGRKGRPA